MTVAYIFVNAAVFLLYGLDKYRAVHGTWRIPENTLIAAAVLGCYGALSGMLVFRHKTRKLKFRVVVPLICIAESFLLGMILVDGHISL